jgi:hypothetical protein
MLLRVHVGGAGLKLRGRMRIMLMPICQYQVKYAISPLLNYYIIYTLSPDLEITVIKSL